MKKLTILGFLALLITTSGSFACCGACGHEHGQKKEQPRKVDDVNKEGGRDGETDDGQGGGESDDSAHDGEGGEGDDSAER
jgi:hypothetical protein